MATSTAPHKASCLWIHDTRGYPSLSVTLVVVSFIVTTVAYVLSIFDKVGPVSIRPFDVQACGIYMVPILAHYWARRQTDASLAAKMQPQSDPTQPTPSGSGVTP
jgi:hypothetical protein